MRYLTVKLFQNQHFVLIVILIFALLLRFYKIDNPVADWHSWRQADTASVTRIYINEGIDLLKPRYHDISYLQSGRVNPQGWRFVEFPIYNALNALLVKNLGVFSLEVWGRLISIFASSVSTVLIFLITKRFLATAYALLAAFFFAFLPFNIYFSRVILPEPLSVALALSALYSFILWLDKDKNPYLVFSTILFAVALLVKPFAIFYILPMFYLAAVKFNFSLSKILKNKKLWIFLLASLLPVMLWRIWMLQFPEGIPFYSWVFNGDGIRLKPSFFKWIFGERLGILILGVWGILPFSAGLLAKSTKKELHFPLIFALSMLAYLIVVASANVRHDYYQTLIIPAVSIILAKGTITLWQTTALYRLLTKIFLIVAILWGLLFAGYRVREFYKINHPEIVQAGETLDRIAPDNALVVAPYNGDTAFLYHTKRKGWPYQTYSIEELVRLGANFYVSVNLNDPETQDVERKYEISEKTNQYVIVDLGRKRLPKN